jgi:hypothetical protein
MGLGLGLLVAGVLFLPAVRFLAGLLSWVVRTLVVLAALHVAVQAPRWQEMEFPCRTPPQRGRPGEAGRKPPNGEGSRWK